MDLAIGCRSPIHEPGNVFSYIFWDLAMRKGYGAGSSIFLFHPFSLNSCKPLYLDHVGFSTLAWVRLHYLGSLISWASVSTGVRLLSSAKVMELAFGTFVWG